MEYIKHLNKIGESLTNIERTGLYDVDKYGCSLAHLTKQLEYFYCNLVERNNGDVDSTFYKIHTRPKEHQLAYFNIGRGFPKELMDGHWCYILKDFGYKMLVIPCTSIKEESGKCNINFEIDIDVLIMENKTKCRMQVTDLRSIDIQRLDLRKSYSDVITDRNEITNFIDKKIF